MSHMKEKYEEVLYELDLKVKKVLELEVQNKKLKQNMTEIQTKKEEAEKELSLLKSRVNHMEDLTKETNSVLELQLEIQKKNRDIEIYKEEKERLEDYFTQEVNNLTEKLENYKDKLRAMTDLKEENNRLNDKLRKQEIFKDKQQGKQPELQVPSDISKDSPEYPSFLEFELQKLQVVK